MPIKLSYVMRKSDWIKLVILIAVAGVAFTKLYNDYREAERESAEILSSIEREY